jgi:hypothetical protein
LSNRENLRLRIEQLQAELTNWHELLATDPSADENHPLLTVLQQVVTQREQWEAQAFLKRWDDPVTTATRPPTEGRNMFRQMFFGNLGGRRGEQKKQK